MYLRKIKNENLKQILKYTSPFTFRILFYLFITILFYYFMQNFSPLGIKWRPYHYERVIHAIENIIENPILTFIGVTSWNEVQEVKQNLDMNLGSIRLVPVLGYLFYAFCYKFIDNFLIKSGGISREFPTSLIADFFL